MRLSLNWLQDFVALPISPSDLAERLTLAGLEVEGLEILEPRFKGVIVGRVEKVEPHPQADRLQVTTVFDGHRHLQVVCGAPNVRPGGVYPLAPAGAVLADGHVLKPTKLRGVMSEGMLLAEDELGLSEDHSGLLELPQDLRPGQDLAAALALQDVVLEVAVTPNRPDCLSVYGLAREVAALLDLPLKQPSVQVQETEATVASLAGVEILAPEDCPRYTARLLVDLTVKPSPLWLRLRLQAAGLRAINNLVDVTNYVMLELGQPLHAFDFDRLRGGRIVVRRPRPGEEHFVTLDGQTRPLTPETLLICDAEVPVAIGGIMGGLDSEVTPTTCRVLLESAYFNPTSIRRTAKRLGLQSESAYRFERGVDPEGVILALNRAAQLMADLGGGKVLRGLIDVYPQPLSSPTVSLRMARVNSVLGTDWQENQVADFLKRLQLPATVSAPGTFTVAVPSFRRDLTREIDLIEEVARLGGYDQIPVTRPRLATEGKRPNKETRLREAAKELLTAQGFYEVINYAFQPERWTTWLFGDDPARQFVRLANPLSEEQAVMRRSLLPGLLETMRRNAAYLNRNLKIFEVGKVFHPEAGAELPAEPLLLAGLLTGARQTPSWDRPEQPVDYYDLKGVIENLLAGLLVRGADFQAAAVPYLRHGTRVVAADLELGIFGELQPTIGEKFDLAQPAWLFEFDVARLAAVALERPHFRSLPRYPAVFRDLAIILEASRPVGEVMAAIAELGHPWLVEVELFDIYTGPPVPPGEKSLAFHLTYRDPERTLTDAEVNARQEAVIAGLAVRFGARLRT